MALETEDGRRMDHRRRKRLVIAGTATAVAVAAVAAVALLVAPKGAGLAFGGSDVLSSSGVPAPLNMSLDGYTDNNMLSRIAAARKGGYHLLFNLTGGSHDNYVTSGQFDVAKWQQKLSTFNTPSIRQAVADGVRDGVIVGASVLDEPQQCGAGNPKSYGACASGSKPAYMTKARVDDLCGRVTAIFPTLPSGVVHDYRLLEPEKNYAKCAFLMSQYRLKKGAFDTYLRESLAFTRRSHMSLILSLNILHGGTPGTNCPKYAGAQGSDLCPMSPAQLKEWGTKAVAVACAVNMWRHEPAYFARADIKAAMKAVADAAAKVPARSCRRSTTLQ